MSIQDVPRGGYGLVDSEKTVAIREIDGKNYSVVMCWSGGDPEHDTDRYYDIFDDTGRCINEGEPWHDDGLGIPTAEEIQTLVQR
jgi:hypothetical protein